MPMHPSPLAGTNPKTPASGQMPRDAQCVLAAGGARPAPDGQMTSDAR